MLEVDSIVSIPFFYDRRKPIYLSPLLPTQLNCTGHFQNQGKYFVKRKKKMQEKEEEEKCECVRLRGGSRTQPLTVQKNGAIGWENARR